MAASSLAWSRGNGFASISFGSAPDLKIARSSRAAKSSPAVAESFGFSKGNASIAARKRRQFLGCFGFGDERQPGVDDELGQNHPIPF